MNDTTFEEDRQWLEDVKASIPKMALHELQAYASFPTGLGLLAREELDRRQVSEIAPGLDPTPVALAGEILSSTAGLPARPWEPDIDDPETDPDFTGKFYYGNEGRSIHFHDAEGIEAVRFLFKAANAAETLARAVLEGEKALALVREAHQQAESVIERAGRDIGQDTAGGEPFLVATKQIKQKRELAEANAYARGRIDGIEAEKKASVAVFESRKEWAKRAEAAEARLRLSEAAQYEAGHREDDPSG